MGRRNLCAKRAWALDGRKRAWALVGGAAAFACVACGGAKERGPAIGSSTAPVGGATVSADGGVVSGPPLSPLPSDFRTSMTHVTAARFLSKGHAGGRWDAEVYADPAGAEALHAEKWPVAAGTRFVEEHFERSDGGAGPLMMMEKRPPGFDPAHGDWRYVAVGTRGEVVKDGAIESCAGCHGEAPGDHVFRVGGEK